MTFEDLAAMKRIGVSDLSPDGQWIAYDLSRIDLASNARTSAIHLMRHDGSANRAITDGTKQDESPAWSPDGKTIAFVSNRDGSTKQVWLYDVASGSTRKLTNLLAGAGSVRWSPRGDAVFVVSDVYPECGVDPKCAEEKNVAAEKEPTKARVIDSLFFRHWNAWTPKTRAHILHVPVDGSAPRDLTPGAFDAGGDFDISPDGSEIVYVRNSDERPEVSTNSDLFVAPVAGGEAKQLTTRKGADSSPEYSPDGKWIAWHSQERAGYESDLWELWAVERSTGKAQRIAPDFEQYVAEIEWAPDSRSIYFVAPLKGKNAVHRVTLDGRVTLLDASASAGHLEVSPDGRTVYLQMSSFSRPVDIYSMTGTRLTRLTRDNDERLAIVAMGESENISWKGAGDTPIQGFLITPPGFDASKRYPAVVLIHGGPQGAWSDSWSYRWNPQMFAARGYVVLMPNPRGSTGFGQRFIEEISRDWGGRVYTDIMNGVDVLASRPYVDGDRLGAAGASYGGYMVNWILGHSDRFKALVSHAGVYNLESMAGVTEELWFPDWEFGGPYWEAPEDYAKWSPHRFVKSFKTPTLVVHGELDFRVPIGEGLQLFTALQRRGVPSRLLYFPDEGHWVLKPQNSKLWHETVLGWLDRWLK
jgi:dipeptidyl aminopeptidase/acylaminoacyl peptidase